MSAAQSGGKFGGRSLRNRRKIKDPTRMNDYVDSDKVTLKTWYSKPGDDSDEVDEDEALAFSDDEFIATMSDYEDDDKEDFDLLIPHQESEPESGDDMDASADDEFDYDSDDDVRTPVQRRTKAKAPPPSHRRKSSSSSSASSKRRKSRSSVGRGKRKRTAPKKDDNFSYDD